MTKYWFGINSDPTSEQHADHVRRRREDGRMCRPTRLGAELHHGAGVRLRPATDSEIRTYQFRVKAGQPARAQWTLDEAAGATQAEGSAGERTLQVNGTPDLGAPGAVGNAVTFNGDR